MPTSIKGFSLIELMIAIAIIGILAALAIPAYQDYAVRAKISEAINFAAAAKISVAEHYMSEGRLPRDLSEAGLVSINTRYLDSLSYQLQDNTGHIILTLSDQVSESVAQQRITLSATASQQAFLQWECRPADDNGVAERYLPSSCH